MPKIRWGVLGTAKIAMRKVIPAMQSGECTEVVAIASREASRAEAAARSLEIPRFYGSYEALLADPAIDAIYNPLPNHLHVPWTTAAADAGKHVLCEKPIGLNRGDVETLMAVRDRTGVLIQEAFMVRWHPQWARAVALCRSGDLGDVRLYAGEFSYFQDDPDNIRNVAAWGGGGLLDIGCYLIMTSRLIFDEEPRRVMCLMERDAGTGVDTLSSLVLDYPSGQAIGACGTQLVGHQRVRVFGTAGKLEIEIPFNAPPDRPCRVFVDRSGDPSGSGRETIDIAACDQYRLQGDRFSRAVLERRPAPYSLEQSLANMAVIDAAFRSASSGRWETP